MVLHRRARCRGERPDESLRPPRPDNAGLPPWLVDRATAFVETSAATPDDTEVWTWWRANKTAASVARRMANEMSVHRWDAEVSAGEPAPIEVVLARDGIEEFFDVFLGADAAYGGPPGRVRFVPAEGGRAWTADLGDGPLAEVKGPVSDLVLLLWNRVHLGRLEVSGDHAVLDAFLAWSDLS